MLAMCAIITMHRCKLVPSGYSYSNIIRNYYDIVYCMGFDSAAY